MKSAVARDFKLLDNSVPQRVSLEDRDAQPIALVVLMQTGGHGSDQFGSNRNLPHFLHSMVGNSANDIMLVMFDSRVRMTWHFPTRTDGVEYAMSHPMEGDAGTAIFDAVNYAVDSIQQETGNFRRIVLLISEPQDDGSQTSPEDLIRHLGQSNTSVYSLTFLPSNRPSPYFGSKNHDPQVHHETSYRQSSKHKDDVRGSTPLEIALRAMRKNAAEEISTLSGGAHLRFRNEAELEARLSAITDDIRNRHILSFQPNLHQRGFHTLAVQLEPPKHHVDILARTSYWYEPSSR
jgi:VWFA-related protein